LPYEVLCYLAIKRLGLRPADVAAMDVGLLMSLFAIDDVFERQRAIREEQERRALERSMGR
jgi:hypothetical protein